MNKADQEILEILKHIFQLKIVRPMVSDANLRLWIIRSLFITSILCILLRIIWGLLEKEVTSDFSALINTPIAFFFTLLFLHINNKSENSSLIMLILTWASLIISLYV